MVLSLLSLLHGIRNLHSSPVLENIRMSFFSLNFTPPVKQNFGDSTLSLCNSSKHEFSNILKFLLLQSELFTFLRKENYVV